MNFLDRLKLFDTAMTSNTVSFYEHVTIILLTLSVAVTPYALIPAIVTLALSLRSQK